MDTRPVYGDKMKLAQFVSYCKSGFFIDSDGHGYYATVSEMTNIPAIPSRIVAGNILHKYTHVVWFNK